MADDNQNRPNAAALFDYLYRFSQAMDESDPIAVFDTFAEIGTAGVVSINLTRLKELRCALIQHWIDHALEYRARCPEYLKAALEDNCGLR